MYERTAVLSEAEESVLDEILDATPSIAVVANADGRILRVGRDSCRLSGWSAHEIEGLALRQYVALFKPSHPNGRLFRPDELAIVRALRGEHVQRAEGVFSHRSGERIPTVVHAVPFRDRDGRVRGAITSVTDLRNFKTIERRLRAATDHILSVSQAWNREASQARSPKPPGLCYPKG